MRRSIRPSAALAVATLLFGSGCAVGPDFERPAAPDVKGYTAEPPKEATSSADVAGGGAQRFVGGKDIPGQWWQLFRSPALDGLVRQALDNNPDLQAAQAALRQAQQLSAAQGGALFPAVDAGFSETRQKFAGAQFGQPALSSIFSLANASVGVSYVVDVFGGTRRAIESAEAQAEMQRYQLEASYLSLTANVVTAAVQEASLRAQVAATRDIIELETTQLDVVRRQFEVGGASKADVLAQEATLAQARANLPPLEKMLAQQRNMLTALVGRFPSQEIAEKFDLEKLELPLELPLSLPSQLVEQRPDIRAAEAQLHQASAEVGVAIANRLPSITLNANAASYANKMSDLFSAGTGAWAIGAGVTQPIFRGGALMHEQDAAEAALDMAAAQYRSTVISAFRNVADTLRALQSDADALKEQLAAETAASDSLGLARQQYSAGAISYLTLLNAERTYEQTRIGLIQAQALRFADTAALFQALGGGWWNRNDLAKSAT